MIKVTIIKRKVFFKSPKRLEKWKITGKYILNGLQKVNDPLRNFYYLSIS